MGSLGSDISFDEYLACSELTFEWADSYDTKDWDRLASILAPTVKIHYKSVNDFKDDKLPAADFVSMMSAPQFLGDPLIHTQHLMGAHKYRKVAPGLIEGYHQIRAAHQRYTGDGLLDVEAKGHGHAVITLTYALVDGKWKWGGITTDIRWNEYQFDQIFKFKH
ncbi:putative scytalone dehydratase [Aspergillus oleicola]